MDEPTPGEIVREFYLYRMSRRDTLGEFLAHYHRLWVEASEHGVLGVSGIIHLIPLLPLTWRHWAISIVPEYIGIQLWGDHYYGDCRGFIAAISSRYFCYGGPPPELYDPPSPPLHPIPPVADLPAPVFGPVVDPPAPSHIQGEVNNVVVDEEMVEEEAPAPDAVVEENPNPMLVDEDEEEPFEDEDEEPVEDEDEEEPFEDGSEVDDP